MAEHSRSSVTPAVGCHAGWLRDAGARQPPPCLPDGRRSFLADGAMAHASRLYTGAGGLRDTLDQMAPLAARLVAAAHLVEQMPGSMPAGYTYLAQLLAHDVAAATSDGVPGGTARAEGLMLDSIFGPAGAAMPGLFRFRASASDPGRPVSVDLLWRNGKAQVFDDRNGDTPMLSQMSALFVCFCLRAEEALQGRFAAARARRLARCLTAGVFHEILRHDLLPRLLHPAVWARCRAPGWQPLETAAAGPLVPVEFTHAAFRFGHAMVRSTYLLNDRSPALPLAELVRGFPALAERRAHNSNFWRVDWRLFFGAGPGVQMARRIGPNLPPDLEVSVAPAADNGARELAMKDLAGSASGGLQSVAALAGALRGPLAAEPAMQGWALWDSGARQALMRGWLGAQPGREPGHLATDPPPYLYMLVESGWENTAAGGGAGRGLGALGSVLSAEVILPLLRRAEAALAAERQLGAARAALGPAPLPRTMPELVEFLTQQD